MVPEVDVPLIILIVLNLWIAWRYSNLPLGQDEGIWLLWGFTGAIPYKDHVDCKPPGIHLWLWLLARLTRKNLRITRFIHHTVVGSFAAIAYKITGSFSSGLAFTALAQSAWLTSFHAWLEAMSAGFLLLALLLEPWLAMLCIAFAILFNLKLAIPGIVILLWQCLWLQLILIVLSIIVILAIWRTLWPSIFRGFWYANVTVPSRMIQWRKTHGQRILPRWDNYFAIPLILVVPAMISAFMSRTDPLFIVVTLVYICINSVGRVWRPYHWIPLSAIIAAAQPPSAVLILLAEWIASGLYLGNLVSRIQPQAIRYMDAAKAIGEKLQFMEGSLWVGNEFTQIYIYARKRPVLRLVEQVEIRHVVVERRKEVSPIRPDLLVLGPEALLFPPEGYYQVSRHDVFTIYRMIKDRTFIT